MKPVPTHWGSARPNKSAPAFARRAHASEACSAEVSFVAGLRPAARFCPDVSRTQTHALTRGRRATAHRPDREAEDRALVSFGVTRREDQVPVMAPGGRSSRGPDRHLATGRAWGPVAARYLTRRGEPCYQCARCPVSESAVALDFARVSRLVTVSSSGTPPPRSDFRWTECPANNSNWPILSLKKVFHPLPVGEQTARLRTGSLPLCTGFLHFFEHPSGSSESQSV